MEKSTVIRKYGIKLGILSLIILFSYLNILPLIAADKVARQTDMISLRVAHWPGDYYYYLSQFKLGERNIFLSEDLFTHEFRSGTLVGWVNVFIGHIFHIIGVSSFDAYPIAIVATTVIFLLVSYRLLQILFSSYSQRHSLAPLAFILFLFSNAVPKFDFTAHPVGIWFYDYWFNIGLPLTRLGGVPHQLLERALVVISMILFLRPISKKGVMGIITSLVGFTLSSIEPVHFLLVLATLGLCAGYAWVFQKKKDISFVILYALFGIPVVIYLKKLFLTLPEEEMLVHVRWQLPTAFRLGLPVEDQLFFYEASIATQQLR
jgi:hypothetical protein